MYSYSEIPFQNMQDCLTGLFLTLGNQIMEVMGRKGETVIRKAVQRFGVSLGEEVREKLKQEGKRQSLKELAEQEDLFLDPRFRILPIRTRQQELWAEVHTCPIADYMKAQGGTEIGLMFCEEFCHAFFKGYTDGKAQANLSKVLMGSFDNHCRFSIYYRPANLEAEKRDQVFDLKTTELEADLPDQKLLHNTEWLQKLYLRLYASLYEEAEALGGQEGICAIAMGLRILAVKQKEDLEKWAGARRMACDAQFIENNYPVQLEEEKNIFSSHLNENEEKLFRENFLKRF